MLRPQKAQSTAPPCEFSRFCCYVLPCMAAVRIRFECTVELTDAHTHTLTRT
jgi:hypothetical protein